MEVHVRVRFDIQALRDFDLYSSQEESIFKEVLNKDGTEPSKKMVSEIINNFVKEKVEEQGENVELKDIISHLENSGFVVKDPEADLIVSIWGGRWEILKDLFRN